MARWRERVDLSKNAQLVDRLSYKLNQTKKDWFVVSKVIDIEATKEATKKDKSAEPVVISEITSTKTNTEKNGT